MTAPRRRRAARSRNTDLCDFTPVSSRPWVQAALDGPGAIVSDIAKSVADAAVFAAMEAIAEQGVTGGPEFWEIDALHQLITDIVVQRLHRHRVITAPAVARMIADAGDAAHESREGCVTRLTLTDREAPR